MIERFVPDICCIFYRGTLIPERMPSDAFWRGIDHLYPHGTSPLPLWYIKVQLR